MSKPKWLTEIEKQFGQGAIKRGSDLKPREYRGTGSIALDVALGGGWGKNSIVQLMGKEGSGKTLLIDLAIIEAQRREEKRGLIFDFEGTYDRSRFAALGGNLDMLDVIDHESVNKPMLFAEDAIDIVKSLFKHGSDHAVIGFDSTAAMISVHQYEAKMEHGQEKATMYSVARVLSEGIPIMLGTMFKSPSEPTIFFVSQGRDNIGAMTMRGIPPRDKQTGGRALPFYASTRINVSKGDVYKADVEDEDTGRNEKGIEVGHKTRVAVWKNKCNRVQGRTAEFDVYNEGEVHGVDRVAELAQLSIYTRVVVQSGSWLTLPSGTRLQGKDALKEALSDDQVFETIDKLTRAALARMMDTAPRALDPEDSDDNESPTEQEAFT